MLTKCIVAIVAVAFCGMLVSSNPYGPTYNDAGYEQASYQPQQQYHQAAPAYHQPSYPKYQAPSSAHHTQYDNYIPRQTYSKPMYYAPAKPMYQPAPMYHQPAYSAPKPAYPPQASYGHDMEEYKARA